MPVIMHVYAFAVVVHCEGLFLGRPLPQIPIQAFRRIAGAALANIWTPFVAYTSGHVHIIADKPILQFADALLESGIAAQLCAVLDDPSVFLGGLDHFAAFKNIVGHRLFDIDVLARLARPDGCQRMPMIGRGNGQRVNIVVFQYLAYILLHLRFGFARP